MHCTYRALTLKVFSPYAAEPGGSGELFDQTKFLRKVKDDLKRSAMIYANMHNMIAE